MKEVDIVEAAASLPQIVAEIAPGEEVLLTRDGRGVARITPVPPPQRIRLGLLEGQFEIPDDFDAPLPDDLLDLFEGR